MASAVASARDVFSITGGNCVASGRSSDRCDEGSKLRMESIVSPKNSSLEGHSSVEGQTSTRPPLTVAWPFCWTSGTNAYPIDSSVAAKSLISRSSFTARICVLSTSMPGSSVACSSASAVVAMTHGLSLLVDCASRARVRSREPMSSRSWSRASGDVDSRGGKNIRRGHPSLSLPLSIGESVRRSWCIISRACGPSVTRTTGLPCLSEIAQASRACALPGKSVAWRILASSKQPSIAGPMALIMSCAIVMKEESA